MLQSYMELKIVDDRNIQKVQGLPHSKGSQGYVLYTGVRILHLGFIIALVSIIIQI